MSEEEQQPPPPEQQDQLNSPEPSAEPPQPAQASTSTNAVSLPATTTKGVVWRLQYVPTVVFGDGTSAPSGFPNSTLPGATVPTGNAHLDATAAPLPSSSDASAAGKTSGEPIPVSFVGMPQVGTEGQPQQQVATPPKTNFLLMVTQIDLIRVIRMESEGIGNLSDSETPRNDL